MFLNHDGDYDSIRAAFSWEGRVPEYLNLAHECCERWAANDGQRLAMIYEHADRSVERYPLPGVWFSAGEIHALLSMQQLLAALDTGGILAEHIAPLRERLASMLDVGQYSADNIVLRIRLLSAAARPCTPQHFPTIAADRKSTRLNSSH